ncbi:MAG TPA: tetratricopeptide repeat protein [Candidatus Ozemobacteraceae bacterium]
MNHGIRALLLATLLAAPLLAQAPAAGPQKNPNDAVLLYHEAMNEYSLRHLKAARDHLDTLVKEWPQHPISRRARIELARICIDLRDHERAIELLTAVADGPAGDGDTATALETLVDLLFSLQRFKLGIDLLEKRWQANPTDVDLGRSLAKFYLQAGRSDEAQLLLEGLLERTARREVFSDLLALATKTGTVERLMSGIQQRSARYRAADYLEFVSDCLMALKKTDEAAKLLRESPETSTDINLLRKLARLELERNDPAASLQALRQLEQLLPNEWETAKAAGHCLFLMGKPAEALAEWRRYLGSQTVPRPDGYQLFTEVLIEHKMYAEALEAFAQARQALGNPTQFAEERAGVLEAMERHEEALEEYLIAMANGLYKADIFDKLYNNQSAKFDLRDRLRRALAASGALSLKKALLELMMREEKIADLPEIAALAESDPSFEELLYERIRQSLASSSGPFAQALGIDLIGRYARRELALKLCRLLLDRPDANEKELTAAVAAASATVAIDPPADAKLRAILLVALGRTMLERLHAPDAAVAFFTQALQPPLPTIAPEAAFDAALLMMRCSICRGETATAEAYLASASAFANAAPRQPPPQEKNPDEQVIVAQDENGGLDLRGLALDPDAPLFDGIESQARLLFETAWLKAHVGEYEAALDVLKKITEEYPESLWMDDGLRLALQLTMGSAGSLDHLKTYLEAERLAMIGSLSAAVSALENLSTNASGTPLALDAEATALLYAETTTDPARLAQQIETFIARHPAHGSVPDLMMLQWRLLRKTNAPAASEVELLKSFADRFPGDLRSRRARVALAELLRQKR